MNPVHRTVHELSRTICLELFLNMFNVQELFIDSVHWTVQELFTKCVPWNLHEPFMNMTISCSRTIHVLFMHSVHELFLYDSWIVHDLFTRAVTIMIHHEQATLAIKWQSNILWKEIIGHRKITKTPFCQTEVPGTKNWKGHNFVKLMCLNSTLCC